MTRSRTIHAHVHERGVAMLLVLIAVALATVLSSAFLSAQSTTRAISENAQEHTRAREVAESAMDVVVQFMRANEDWRSTFTEGTWMTNQALAGGTVTVTTNDGEDSDGDGDIDGDGDLTDDNTDPLTITIVGTVDGRTHRIRAVLTPVPGEQEAVSPFGAVAKTEITMKNNARIDAFNATTGTYSPSTNSSTAASIATNSTSSQKVKLENDAKMIGDVAVGVGGSTSTVIKISNNATISGTRSVLTEAQTVPSVPAFSPPSSLGSFTSANSGSSTLTAGTYRHSSYTLKNSFIVNISGAVTIYCDGKFSIDNSAQMKLNAGATLTVYANEFEFKNDSRLNATSPATPSRTILYTLSNKDISIDNTSQVAADILGPTNKLKIKNTGRFFGRFQGDKLEVENNGRFTQDLSLTGGGSGGGSSSSIASYQLIWVELE